MNRTDGANATWEDERNGEASQWLKFAFLMLIVVVTIVGNSLVGVSLLRFRALRTVTNYFIGSLAVADLLLGCFVLPFSAINTLQPVWPFGVTFCNIYVASDVCLCTSSILNLFAIAVERYVCIAVPFHYRNIVTKRYVVATIVTIWVLSLLVSFIPLHVGWNTEDGEVQNSQNPDSCTLEASRAYNVAVAISTFFVPTIIMWVLYWKIMQIARRQAQQLNQLAALSIRLMSRILASPTKQGKKSEHQRQARERKATVTVAAILGAFTLCWVPYFLVFTVRPFLADHIPLALDTVILWLGYINSTLNPIVYTFINRTFRRAFRHVLCCSKGDSLGLQDSGEPGLGSRPGSHKCLPHQQNGTNVPLPRPKSAEAQPAAKVVPLKTNSPATSERGDAAAAAEAADDEPRPPERTATPELPSSSQPDAAPQAAESPTASPAASPTVSPAASPECISPVANSLFTLERATDDLHSPVMPRNPFRDCSAHLTLPRSNTDGLLCSFAVISTC